VFWDFFFVHVLPQLKQFNLNLTLKGVTQLVRF